MRIGDGDMSEEWKANKELTEWARNHFKGMNAGGVWMPEGSGLTYRKGDDKSWTLVQMVDSDDARDNHNRMKTLMWDAGITINDGDYKTLPQPQSAEEAHMMDLHMKRELAQTWTDKDGTLLTDMGLADVFPEFVEDREILLVDGNATSIEIWAYKALNPNTGEYISIDPDDFHLLMGDDHFMRFEAVGCRFFALTRGEMVEFIDNGEPRGGRGVGVGSRIGADRVPPWLWGSYCRVEGRSNSTYNQGMEVA